jgi:predicted nucleic acid-binding protein
LIELHSRHKTRRRASDSLAYMLMKKGGIGNIYSFDKNLDG